MLASRAEQTTDVSQAVITRKKLSSEDPNTSDSSTNVKTRLDIRLQSGNKQLSCLSSGITAADSFRVTQEQPGENGGKALTSSCLPLGRAAGLRRTPSEP